MRHDDADEADDAGEGDGDADDDRDGEDDAALQPLDIDAEMARLGLAEHQRIEAARDERARRRARRGSAARQMASFSQVAPARLPMVQKVSSRSCASVER